MHRIFIVEDDAAIAAALQKHLTTWGFDVRCAEDFRNVLTECTAFDPQLVLLDITLPFYNGYHWCQELRRVSNVPVVFISSASDNMNIVMAMNMGGDDFIAKPFDLNVLLAKIQAILRRTYDFAAPAPTLEHRGAVLNTADASLMYQGQRIELTKNDYRILQTLLERKGSVVSRETLMEKLWETDSFVDENTLTVNIARLRRKLEAAGLSDYITTKKGLGYLRLESPSSDYVIRNYALDDIVRQAVRKYASQFIRRRLRLEYTPLNVSVITDEKWLLFVIEQVLSNALKYTRSGSVSITLEAPKTLCIRDTGIGIAPEDLPRVFEKGFTGCNGRTDKRATGIGLYLCRRILEKLGHTIAITSTVGEGTTVRIGLQQDALEVE